MKILILVLCCLLVPLRSDATPQSPDTVKYNDAVFTWRGNGLDPVLKARKIEFAICRTDAYDGHIARWEIKDNKLFLVELLAWVKSKQLEELGVIKKVGLEFLFPDTTEVFADWFSGEIFLLESENKFTEKGIIEVVYWQITVESGAVKNSSRIKETFDFHDDEQTSRYYQLFQKSPMY